MTSPPRLDARAHRSPMLAVALAAVLLASCVEQSREKKKFGRTFETTSLRANMPFSVPASPDGRWVDSSTARRMNPAPDLTGIVPRSRPRR